jgi:hypothetical protein
MSRINLYYHDLSDLTAVAESELLQPNLNRLAWRPKGEPTKTRVMAPVEIYPLNLI